MDKHLLDKLALVSEEEQRLLAGGPISKGHYTKGSAFRVDSALMLKKGQSIALRPHTRFAPFPRHIHDYVEMMYMCSGRTVHHFDTGAPLALQQGELLVLGKNTAHAIEQAGAQDIAVNFIVLPPFFDAAFAMIGADNVLGQFLLNVLRGGGSDISYLHFKVADVLPVQNLLENMIWSLANEVPNQRRINQNTMALLFLQLLNHTGQLTAAQSPSHGHAIVVEALREIEENYPAASLNTVAQKYGVSAAYISTLVRRATGQTFKHLLQTKRLDKAALLLRQSSLPVEDILTAIGYRNSSYFYRIFRTVYGMTPGEYREGGSP